MERSYGTIRIRLTSANVTLRQRGVNRTKIQARHVSAGHGSNTRSQ
jgi:hypothetical protein